MGISPWQIAILLVVVLNFIGVALAAKSLITNIKNMSFSRTRKYLLKNICWSKNFRSKKK